MKIRFYGQLGDKLGAEIDLAPPSETATVAELRALLTELFPEAARDLLQRSRACIADAIVGEDRTLADAELVEFFPPLSGG